MHYYRDKETIKQHIDAAMGRIPPDLVLLNGEIVNTVTKEIYQADIAIKGEYIVRVGDLSDLNLSKVIKFDFSNKYLIPGLIDSHLHTESTLLTATNFTKAALPRGTTTVVVDPHEITNVLGIAGLKEYINETSLLPLEFLVEIPSCVPAAPTLENGPSTLLADDYRRLVTDEKYFALAEMMNYPGVIYCDDEVLTKLSLAERNNMLREGHAPQLSGKDLQAYLAAGISSCHENNTVPEVLDKIRAGMKIQLREGSFARNLKTLADGIKDEFGINSTAWDHVITCSDDKHADDIFEEGHIDYSVRKLINEIGLDPITAIRIATINPANHLRLPELGFIGPGKIANILTINNLEKFNVEHVFSSGKLVAKDHNLLINLQPYIYPKRMLDTVKPAFIPGIEDFGVDAPIEEGSIKAHVIGVIDHSLVTDHLVKSIKIEDGKTILGDDLGYFFLLDRHGKTKNFAKSLVSGFNFSGDVAVASTVAHDSHQLLIAGNDPSCMVLAMKELIKSKGGQIILANTQRGIQSHKLDLPLAGLMSLESPQLVAESMIKMKEFSQKYVQGISEPFMSLSFMALPVIPRLKLTDRGLVDVEKFELIDVFAD